MTMDSAAMETTSTQADRKLHTSSQSGSRLAQHSVSLHLTAAANLTSIAAKCVHVPAIPSHSCAVTQEQSPVGSMMALGQKGVSFRHLGCRTCQQDKGG